MQRYSYIIRLRIWHPFIDPKMITRVLGMDPTNQSEAGQPGKTPKGRSLEGVYHESYWSADPFKRGEYSSTDDLIEDALADVLQAIEPHQTFFQNLRTEGGRIIVEVCSFSGRNYAFELSPEILSKLVTLGVSFVHDVYPYAQNW